jgi:hypothetical protein
MIYDTIEANDSDIRGGVMIDEADIPAATAFGNDVRELHRQLNGQLGSPTYPREI